MAKTTPPSDTPRTGDGHQTAMTPSGAPSLHLGRAQKFGTVRFVPLGLADEVRLASIEALNQILSNTMALRDLYKKCHWQVAGPTFYQLHLLFDKHYEEQLKLVDAVAERVQMLGGVAIAMAHDVAEHQTIMRAPIDAEDVPMMLARIVEAHMHLLMQCRSAARLAETNGDLGTSDLLVSQLIRTNEMQSWFVNEHRIAMPLVKEGTTHASSRITDVSAQTMHS